MNRNGFTGAGGASDKEVRHLGKVGEVRSARNISAQSKEKRLGTSGVFFIRDEGAKSNSGLERVWNFNADKRFTRDGGLYANRMSRQRQFQVILQSKNFREFNSFGRFQGVPGDRRPY